MSNTCVLQNINEFFMNMILLVSNEIMHAFSYMKHMNMLFIEKRACIYTYIKEHEPAESMRFT